MTQNAADTSPVWIDPDDAPELTEELLDQGEVFHGEVFVRHARRGPPSADSKELTSVRLSQEVLAKLREAGPGWQSQVDALLRHALGLDVPRAQETLQEGRAAETAS